MNEYLGKSVLCDTKFILKIFVDDEKEAIELFKKFNIQENNDRCLEYEQRVRIDDTEATKIIIGVAEVEKTTQVQSIEKEKRDKVIKELKNRGLSIRQIVRVPEVSFTIVKVV